METLRAVAGMYLAQRAIRSPKVHVALRKAFGFGSAWAAAHNLGYDRVIDPRNLRNEVIHALQTRSGYQIVPTWG